MTDFSGLLEVAKRGRSLTRSEMRRAMELLLENAVGDEEIAEFLLSLKARGETADEIAAAP